MSSSDTLSSSSDSDQAEIVKTPFSLQELENFKTDIACVVENNTKNILKSLLLSNRRGCKAGNWPIRGVAHSSRQLNEIFALVKSRRMRKKSILDVLRQANVSDNVLRNTIKRAQMLVELSRENQEQHGDPNSELE